MQGLMKVAMSPSGTIKSEINPPKMETSGTESRRPTKKVRGKPGKGKPFKGKGREPNPPRDGSPKMKVKKSLPRNIGIKP